MRYPLPLRAPARIAVTAPSSGVPAALHPRLDLVIGHLARRGFAVEQGQCLRQNLGHVSANAEARAAELMRYLLDDSIAAVLPPWGGELAIELLARLDFAAIAAAKPKWLMGFSDLSTLMLPLTLLAAWATAHGPNLMDLAPAQSDPLSASVFQHLATAAGGAFIQASSTHWQARWRDFAEDPAAGFDLTEPTRLECLNPAGHDEAEFSGRLIGGCLDTIRHLAGSRYGDVPRFIAAHRAEGTILYFENAEMRPCDYARTLEGLRLAGWFEGVSGLILGRSTAPEATEAGALSQRAVVAAALGSLGCPVLLEADIGHRPPHWLMINGALARVRYRTGAATIEQRLV
ncbi:LD-carboxypeptidase [Niveibacterium sp. 24ML]|uniref:S66 family peptidase n=1 Tax=Niveibacterium sp. 24ML TaxID=2985512 RepID=UPI00226DB6F4|nr:S66 peptidase family protein [Niveibacterium sp. 24ML]MCX9157692.1 LD-carboxypeptidase [Niveibacterium sp. 24ML]